MSEMTRISARQKGAATLLVTMILLIAATLLVLYASNTVVGEQRMSANEVRSKQAFQAAEAAIELYIEAMNVTAATFNDATVNARWASANSSYRVMSCSPSAFPAAQQCSDLAANGITPACVPPAAGDRTAWVVACGWSDDSAARRRIVSFVGKSNPLPGDIKNPLIARGNVAFGGNPTVTNYFNNLTVWTGSTLDNTGNTGKTVIRRPSSPAGALTPGQVATQVGNGNNVCTQAADLICTTSSGVFGPDVIQSDMSLANLTPDQFFANFLGMEPNVYKSTQIDEKVAGSDAGSITAGDKIYWVDGDASVSQNIGSEGHPVVLVVDGNLSLGGNATIFGVVFVKGDLSVSGGPVVRGAVLGTGSMSSGGNLNVIYDPDAVGGGAGLGKFASMPGTWRDF